METGKTEGMMPEVSARDSAAEHKPAVVDRSAEEKSKKGRQGTDVRNAAAVFMPLGIWYFTGDSTKALLALVFFAALAVLGGLFTEKEQPSDARQARDMRNAAVLFVPTAVWYFTGDTNKALWTLAFFGILAIIGALIAWRRRPALTRAEIEANMAAKAAEDAAMKKARAENRNLSNGLLLATIVSAGVWWWFDWFPAVSTFAVLLIIVLLMEIVLRLGRNNKAGG